MKNSVLADFQKIRVKEDSKEIPSENMQRSIDVILRNKIVVKVKPGDNCRIAGILLVVAKPISPSLHDHDDIKSSILLKLFEFLIKKHIKELI